MSVNIFNNLKYELNIYLVVRNERYISRLKSNTSARLLTSSKNAISHLENVLFRTFHEIYYYVGQHKLINNVSI